MTNLIYGIKDKPHTLYEWFLYAIQQVLAIFVATVLIAQICGTPISSCLVGACLATLLYQIITGFKSPMFISSCGATCSAVLGALALSPKIGDSVRPNYLYVVIGGCTIFVIYAIVAFIVKKFGFTAINKIFPAIIVGPITIVIGLNLATFIPTYVQVNGHHSNIGIAIAVFTMLIVAISSHFLKGFLKTIPFLIGLIAGYIVSLILTITGVCHLINLDLFTNMSIFQIPDFTWNYWNLNITWSEIVQVFIIFIPVALAAVCEHYSDHKVLSNIIGVDLTHEPGLHRTLLGDGAASALGTIVCGLPNTSYGESIATTGFSRVASTRVITLAALITGALAFINPIQIFIQSIPSCVFGGCAMILYGYIASSGLKTLIANKTDLEDNKNLIIISTILTVGVSGIWFFHESFAGVSLAMILGILLNIILNSKGDKTE